MSKLHLDSIPPPCESPPIFANAGTLLAALIICSCESTRSRIDGAGLYPRAAPAGWCMTKALREAADRRARKRAESLLLQRQNFGRRTVSTGKPGFSTPPGHYTGPYEKWDHVSSLFAITWMFYGNVVRSNIDSRKGPPAEGPISMARECRMRCSSEAVTHASGLARRLRITWLHSFAETNGAKVFRECSRGTPVTVTE